MNSERITLNKKTLNKRSCKVRISVKKEVATLIWIKSLKKSSEKLMKDK
jgi:hypothetical protein